MRAWAGLAIAAAALACGRDARTPPAPAPASADASVDASDAAPDAALAEPAVAIAAAPAPESRDAKTLATGLDAVEAIALDVDDVYVLVKTATAWRLERVPKRGGAPERLDDFHAEAVAIAVDDRQFYAATAVRISEAIHGGAFRTSVYGRVVAASKVGGLRTVLFDGLRGAYGLAVAGGVAYWPSGASDAVGGTSVDAVMRGAPPSYVATKQVGVTSVAADATGVYWTVAGRFDERTKAWPAGAVMRAVGAGASPLAATGAEPRALALDDAAAYWIERGALARVAKSGGVASVVAEKVDRFAVDSARVWWSTGGVIASRPKGGGDATARLDASAPIRALAVDEAFVYFAVAGEVRRAPK